MSTSAAVEGCLDTKVFAPRAPLDLKIGCHDDPRNLPTGTADTFISLPNETSRIPLAFLLRLDKSGCHATHNANPGTIFRVLTHEMGEVHKLSKARKRLVVQKGAVPVCKKINTYSCEFQTSRIRIATRVRYSPRLSFQGYRCQRNTAPFNISSSCSSFVTLAPHLDVFALLAATFLARLGHALITPEERPWKQFLAWTAPLECYTANNHLPYNISADGAYRPALWHKETSCVLLVPFRS